MAGHGYDDVAILRDKSGKPIPQYYDTADGKFKPMGKDVLAVITNSSGQEIFTEGNPGKVSGVVKIDQISNEVVVKEIRDGGNNIGKVDLNSSVPTGSNIIGKVSIDQTNPGITNKVFCDEPGVAEQKSHIDFDWDRVSFDEVIHRIVIYHEASSWQTFIINDIEMQIPAGYCSIAVKGTPRNYIITPDNIEFLIWRLE